MMTGLYFLSLLCLVFFIAVPAEGVFFQDHRVMWEENKRLSNHPYTKQRLRVNDPELCLHERYGSRDEAGVNGLLLINMKQDLFKLDRAEFHLELWGGHPKTADKRFILNGKKFYEMPEVGTKAGHCTYSYPAIDLRIIDLVKGYNVFNFTCSRGECFWGHYMVDEARLRTYIKEDHPDIKHHKLDQVKPAVNVILKKGKLLPMTEVKLSYNKAYEGSIESVDYFARYEGFDDNGDGVDNDWHGFPWKDHYYNHVGSALTPPFSVTWDTRMVPAQKKPMAIKALVRLKRDYYCWTAVKDGLIFPKKRPRVILAKCDSVPIPFWSRANRLNTAEINLPASLKGLKRALLFTKVWDGGQGNVKEPFKINGHPYNIISGTHVHDVVFTKREVNVKHLKSGKNQITLLSDTEHHGIEMIYPGPYLVLRFRN
jgi:hypothetical protein